MVKIVICFEMSNLLANVPYATFVIYDREARKWKKHLTYNRHWKCEFTLSSLAIISFPNLNDVALKGGEKRTYMYKTLKATGCF